LARPTGKVDQADWLARESGLARPTRAVGLADSSALTQKNINLHALAVLEYENYAHQHHIQMLIVLTCWPFDFHALEYAKFEIRQKNQ
jgi:hypothetical protein